MIGFKLMKLNQVDKAEAALLSLRRLLDEGADPHGEGAGSNLMKYNISLQ